MLDKTSRWYNSTIDRIINFERRKLADGNEVQYIVKSLRPVDEKPGEKKGD